MSSEDIREFNQKLLWALTTIETLEKENQKAYLALGIISETANVLLRKPIMETKECRGTVGIIAATALEAMKAAVHIPTSFDHKAKVR